MREVRGPNGHNKEEHSTSKLGVLCSNPAVCQVSAACGGWPGRHWGWHLFLPEFNYTVWSLVTHQDQECLITLLGWLLSLGWAILVGLSSMNFSCSSSSKAQDPLLDCCVLCPCCARDLTGRAGPALCLRLDQRAGLCCARGLTGRTGCWWSRGYWPHQSGGPLEYVDLWSGPHGKTIVLNHHGYFGRRFGFPVICCLLSTLSNFLIFHLLATFLTPFFFIHIWFISHCVDTGDHWILLKMLLPPSQVSRSPPSHHFLLNSLAFCLSLFRALISSYSSWDVPSLLMASIVMFMLVSQEHIFAAQTSLLGFQLTHPTTWASPLRSTIHATNLPQMKWNSVSPASDLLFFCVP